MVDPGYIPAGRNVWAIREDVVAFVCNTKQKLIVRPNEFQYMLETITSRCGSYVSGMWSLPPESQSGNTWDAGYMGYWPGLDSVMTPQLHLLIVAEE